jgi:hypothetical protein
LWISDDTCSVYKTNRVRKLDLCWVPWDTSTIHKTSEVAWTGELLNCRTIELSDYRTVGPSNYQSDPLPDTKFAPLKNIFLLSICYPLKKWVTHVLIHDQWSWTEVGMLDTSAPGQIGTRTLRHLCETFRYQDKSVTGQFGTPLYLDKSAPQKDISALVFFSLILCTVYPDHNNNNKLYFKRVTQLFFTNLTWGPHKNMIHFVYNIIMTHVACTILQIHAKRILYNVSYIKWSSIFIIIFLMS